LRHGERKGADGEGGLSERMCVGRERREEGKGEGGEER
jgi:hypothetical protein